MAATNFVRRKLQQFGSKTQNFAFSEPTILSKDYYHFLPPQIIFTMLLQTQILFRRSKSIDRHSSDLVKYSFNIVYSAHIIVSIRF